MPGPVSFEADASLSRRERERLMRRQIMLDAAKSVFAEKGYAGATLDEIAERAEFGKGTLYNYFEGGKESILFAIFDELYDDMCALIRDAFTSDEATERPVRTNFHRLVVAAFSYFEEREDLFIILIKEAYRLAFSDDQERVAYFHRQRERVVNTLIPPLERAMGAGRIRSMPPHAAAHMLLESIDGLMVHRALSSRSYDKSEACETDTVLVTPQTAADFLTTMLFDGLQMPNADHPSAPDAS